MSEWIKCSDRMPEQYQHVLVFSKWEPPLNAIAVADWRCKYWQLNGEAEGNSTGVAPWQPEEVTHWMPLPELPDEA